MSRSGNRSATPIGSRPSLPYQRNIHLPALLLFLNSWPWILRHYIHSKCRNYLPIDKAYHPRRLESSATPLWDVQISQALSQMTNWLVNTALENHTAVSGPLEHKHCSKNGKTISEYCTGEPYYSSQGCESINTAVWMAKRLANTALENHTIALKAVRT
jgi:hypothetical protein